MVTPPLLINNVYDIDPTLDLEQEIDRLRKEMHAVILAHYYQDADIQDVADFIGDSLDLSRKAAQTDAEVIIFCGVRFMADVAKILNPRKTVLLPDLAAGCSLEDSCKPAAFKAFIDQHPGHTVLTYINSSIEVKALSDVIVTSSNAETIINSIPRQQPIIFAPDQYLGSYLMKKTDRHMVLWQGSCIVHERFSEKELVTLKTHHPDALVIAHPECPEHLLSYAEHIGSTSSLLAFARDTYHKEFIVLTEHGIIHQMQKQSPHKIFHAVPGLDDAGCISCNSCPYMKLNTLEKLYMCMVNRQPGITINETLRQKALRPLQAMLDMSAPVSP